MREVAAVSCAGRPSLESLMERYAAASGTCRVYGDGVDAKCLTAAELVDEARKCGTVPMLECIGDGGATTFRN